jgi:RHS repeat-associated protein
VAQVQNTTTSYQYDVVGNLTQITDPLNRITKQEFDQLNRLTKITNAKNGITQYAYDGSGRPVKVTDARNLATNYTIDGLGNLVTTVGPDTGSTSTTYDEAGNVKTRTDAKGQTATYSYDVLNRLTTVTYSDGGSEAYVYDLGDYGIGRLSQMTDVSGTTRYSYDIHGRVATDVRTIGGQSFTTGYQYDSGGRLVSITYPSGRVVTYGYDSSSRINAISTTKDGITAQLVNQVQYQPFGPLQALVFGNGQNYVRTYDLDGRVTSYSLNGAVQSLSYDAASRLTNVSDQAAPVNNRTYDYDELNRLTSEQRATSSLGYSYDAVGNRTQKVVGGSVTTYGYAPNSNRLTAMQGAPVSIDANGSITNNGTASFNYDAHGRMVSANTAIGQVSYQFNALGQRVQKVTPQGSTIYHYDTNGQLIAESSGTAYTEYVYLDGMPVAILSGAAESANTLYVHTDQLDTPRVLSNQAGTVVWRWDSDGFGNSAASEQPNGQAPVRMNLRFPGQYFDSESNLHYNYFRDYDPQTGRYVQSDPIGLGGGINTYGYVGVNPLSFTDPRGLCIEDLCIGEAIIAARACGAYAPCAAGVVAIVSGAIFSQSNKQARKKSHDEYKAFQRQGYQRDPNDPCQELRNKIAFHEGMVAARTAHDIAFPNPGWPDGKRHADVNDADSKNIERWKKELEDCEKSCKR